MYLFPYAGCERSQIRKPPAKPKVVEKEQAPLMISVDCIEPNPMEMTPELEAQLEDIRFRALLDNEPMDIPTMPKVARDVMFEVCRKHMVHPSRICNDFRQHEFVRARREIVLRWVELGTGYSLSQMGRYMRKDHTSILYALRKAKENPENYAPFIAQPRHKK